MPKFTEDGVWTHPMDALFLRLWTKAVDADEYDKAEWKRLQRFVESICYDDASLTARDRATGAAVER